MASTDLWNFIKNKFVRRLDHLIEIATKGSASIEVSAETGRMDSTDVDVLDWQTNDAIDNGMKDDGRRDAEIAAPLNGWVFTDGNCKIP